MGLCSACPSAFSGREREGCDFRVQRRVRQVVTVMAGGERAYMSVKIVDVDEGVITVRIVGKLQYAEFEKFQKAAAKEIARLEKVRVLVLAEDFEGWGKDGNWGDVSLQASFDKNIERMALVGEEKWQELVSLFTGQGLRRFPIKFFPPERILSAREWLAEVK